MDTRLSEPWSTPEERQPLIQEIDPLWQSPSLFLTRSLLPELIRSLPQQNVRLVDFGSGDGQVSWYFGLHFKGENGQRLLIDQYDPHRASDPRFRDYHTIGHRPDAVTIRATQSLPERGDLVLCHFSLHHTPDPEQTLRYEIGRQLQPSIIVVGEFTFKSIPGIEQRQAAFRQTFADPELPTPERRELEEFVKEAGNWERGFETCYEFHTRWGEAEYITFLESAGYRVTQHYRPRNWDRCPRSILVARRTDRPHLERFNTEPGVIV